MLLPVYMLLYALLLHIQASEKLLLLLEIAYTCKD
jgi:hypothetical protein